MESVTVSQMEDVKATAVQTEDDCVLCSIDGCYVNCLMITIFLLGVILPTLAVIFIPGHISAQIYGFYILFAFLCMIPTSLVFLASINSRLVVHHRSVRPFVKFAPHKRIPRSKSFP